PAFEERRLVGIDWLRNVVVDVAVAELAEWEGTRAANELCDRSVGLADKRRHVCDRHRDVMLDRAADLALHLAEHFADAPEGFGLLERIRDCGVRHDAALDAFGEDRLHRVAQALALL